MTRIAFVDTETTGLSLDDEIWEFAAIVREPDGSEATHHMFIRHDTKRCQTLPEPFLTDQQARFPNSHTAEWHQDAVPIATAAGQIAELLSDKIHIVGAVPNFDTERLALLLRRHGYEPDWHYHLIDVENLAVGYLWRKVAENRELGYHDSILPSLPWDSEAVSDAVGVDPDQFDRHTALGDAQWAKAIYDAVTGDRT